MRFCLGPCPALFAALICLAAGCTHGPSATPTADADAHDPRLCGAGVVAVADEGRVHVPEGTKVAYKNNPPASGSHWPSPHGWGVFLDTVIPREHWVHNLEHGGIVLLFNCPAPDGGAADASSLPCPEITNALVLLHDEVKPNKFGDVLMIVTPDPLLPKRVAAVAWDWVLLADSVDLAELRCFRDARYDLGPELVE